MAQQPYFIITPQSRWINPDGTPTVEFFRLFNDLFQTSGSGQAGTNLTAVVAEIATLFAQVQALTAQIAGNASLTTAQVTNITQQVALANTAASPITALVEQVRALQIAASMFNTAGRSSYLQSEVEELRLRIALIPKPPPVNPNPNVFTSINRASGSAVSLTSTVSFDVNSLTLAAGRWLLFGNVFFTLGATATTLAAWFNTTSATPPGAPNSGGEAILNLTSISSSTGLNFNMYVAPTTSTTYYLSGNATFVSTASGYGFFGAIPQA